MLLAAGIAFALLAGLSLWPPRRPGVLALLCFFPGWLACELPLHAAGLAVLVTGGLVAAGAPLAGGGLAGLVLVGLALAGLLHHARLAASAPAALGRALAESPLVAGLAPAAPARPDWRRLAAVVPIAPPGLTRVRAIQYAPGHRRRRLDVWRPTAVGAGARRPCLLFIHGGAWIVGNKDLQGLCTVQGLAAAGWVCFSMNYRLSPGARFPEHLHDVKRAIAWIRRHGAEHGADPGLLVIAGASAGAHLAALAALTPNVPEHQPDLPGVDTSVAGCVALYGVYDLAERETPFPHRAFRRIILEWLVMKRRFSDAPEAFDAASPLAHARPDAPPFFVIHGDRDSLVPVASGRHFAARLAAAGAPVVYAEVPGAQHAFEVFATRRSHAAVEAIRRFCEAVAARRGG